MFSILSDNVSVSDLKNQVENSRQTRPFEIVQYARLDNLGLEPGYKGITILKDSYFFPQFTTNRLEPGDTILLYGQNDPIQNGVWNVISVFAGYVNIQRPSDYAKNTPIRSGQFVLAFSRESILSVYIPASSTTLTVLEGVTGQPIVLGMFLSGTNIKSGTRIIAFGSGSGSSGTYTISDAPTVTIGSLPSVTTLRGQINNSTATFTGYILGLSNTLTVVEFYVGSSPIVIGMVLSDDDRIKPNTIITSQLTGTTGGSGTYTISDAPTVLVGSLPNRATVRGQINNYKNSSIFKNTTPEYDLNQNKIISYNGSSPQSWQFYRYIYTPIPLSEAPFTVRNGPTQYFTQSSFLDLTDNNLSRPTFVSDYMLHSTEIIGWGFFESLTGGTVQLWWSNNDERPLIYEYNKTGLYIKVGSYNIITSGVNIIYSSTIESNDLVPTNYKSEITIPSNITWNYLQIEAKAINTPSINRNPILWEVRINNIPNIKKQLLL